MGKASTKKKRVGRDGHVRLGARRVDNAATRYLDWLEAQPPAAHNCVIRPEQPGPATAWQVEHGRCVRSDCRRRWKATFRSGRIIGWASL